MPEDLSTWSHATHPNNRPPGSAAPAGRPNVPREPPTGQLPNALFEIAVAAMWGDGVLAADEVQRGHALARRLGASPHRGGSPFDAIAAGALPFGELEFDRLDDDHHRLAYAVACWVTAANTGPSVRHDGFFRALQLRLRLKDSEAILLQEMVHTTETSGPDVSGSLDRLLSALLPLEPVG